MLFVVGFAGAVLALLVLSALRRRARATPGFPAGPASFLLAVVAVLFAAVTLL